VLVAPGSSSDPTGTGVWIDLTQDSAICELQVAALLQRHPSDTPLVVETVGLGSLSVPPDASVADLADCGASILEHGPVFAELLTTLGGLAHLDTARALMTESYQGAFRSPGEWAQHLFAAAGTELEHPLERYISWESLAQDAELAGSLLDVQLDGVHHLFLVCED